MTGYQPDLTPGRNTERSSLLDVRGLCVSIDAGPRGIVEVLTDVSFSITSGSCLGIVGESGSGKSLTSLAVMGLLPSTAHVEGGEIVFRGEDLLRVSDTRRQRVRGGGISMVFQDPLTSLDPSYTIGDQMAEGLKLHRQLRGPDIVRESVALLERVRIPSAMERLRQYPHELSGGMRQRICSALALCGQPDLLIADEPTTALDVTTQAQYLAMLKNLQRTTGFSLILISHDLSIIRQMCDSLVVMYAGQVVESGAIQDVMSAPSHPYTRGLLSALPTLDPSANLVAIPGKAPEPWEYHIGCRFAPRCEHARAQCHDSTPQITDRGTTGQLARCFATDSSGWLVQ